MLKHLPKLLSIASLVIACAGPIESRAENITRETQISYSFGVVPQYEQRKLFAVWRPILDELEKRTGFIFTLTGSPRIPSFEKDFVAGVYDFAYMNPYHVVQAQGENTYVPLLRDGGRVLQGIVVAPKNSPIRSVKELHQQEVVFPSANALGASMLIRRELKERYGIEVIPKYVQTHSSVYLLVAKGLAISGGGVVSTLLTEKAEIQDHLRIIYHTQPLPPHPITAHNRVPVAHQQRVVDAFMALAQTVRGKYLLGQIPIDLLVPTQLQDYKSLSVLNFDGYGEQ